MPDLDSTGMEAVRTRIRFLLEIHGYNTYSDKELLAKKLNVSARTLGRELRYPTDRHVHELACHLGATAGWIMKGEAGLSVDCQCMSYLCERMNENQHKMSLEHMKAVWKFS